MTDLRRFSIGVRLIDEVVMACPHTALKSTWMNRCSGPVMMTPRSGGLRLVDRLREAYPDADVSLFVLHDTHLEHARVDLRISVAHYSIVNNVAHDQRHRRCGLRQAGTKLIGVQQPVSFVERAAEVVVRVLAQLAGGQNGAQPHVRAIRSCGVATDK